MKIGVISDTHIPDRAKEIPQEVLRDLKGVEMILHAGDLVELSVLDKLKAVFGKVRAVCGNMDPYEVRKVLPEKEIITLGKYKIGMMHGYGAPHKLVELMEKVFKGEGVDLVVFGHSHQPINEKRNGVIYFNPGSLTDKIFAPYNSYGIIEINDKIEAKIIKI
ncbi:MAG: metallophosphoesterase family protein [Candidatus Omnitrophota bacterium]|jgi:hypothetical protein